MVVHAHTIVALQFTGIKIYSTKFQQCNLDYYKAKREYTILNTIKTDLKRGLSKLNSISSQRKMGPKKKGKN